MGIIYVVRYKVHRHMAYLSYSFLVSAKVEKSFLIGWMRVCSCFFLSFIHLVIHLRLRTRLSSLYLSSPNTFKDWWHFKSLFLRISKSFSLKLWSCIYVEILLKNFVFILQGRMINFSKTPAVLWDIDASTLLEWLNYKIGVSIILKLHLNVY